jgi:hypothetical protein
LPTDVLNEAVRLTFEEMAFLDVAPGPAVPPAIAFEEGPVLYLEYSRPQNGALALFLPKEIKFQVAEAIYGESWEGLTALQLDDSLLELLNVLAGRLLTHRFNGASGYTMGLPTVLYDGPTWPAGVQQEFVFHVDSWEFTLVWCEVQA